MGGFFVVGLGCICGWDEAYACCVRERCCNVVAGMAWERADVAPVLCGADTALCG